MSVLCGSPVQDTAMVELGVTPGTTLVWPLKEHGVAASAGEAPAMMMAPVTPTSIELVSRAIPRRAAIRPECRPFLMIFPLSVLRLGLVPERRQTPTNRRP